MWVISFAACGVLLAVAAGVVKRFAPEFFSPIILSFSVVTLTFLLPKLYLASEEFIGVLPAETNNIGLLIKIVAVNIIASSAADVCEDSSAKSVGNMIMLAAQTASVIMALPIMRQLIELIGSILL